MTMNLATISRKAKERERDESMTKYIMTEGKIGEMDTVRIIEICETMKRSL